MSHTNVGKNFIMYLFKINLGLNFKVFTKYVINCNILQTDIYLFNLFEKNQTEELFCRF